LQRGIAAISAAKILWALFEEDECRAAHWLHESGLSLEQFWRDFGIQILQSPITAPPFPVGSYGVSAGQYTAPPPPQQNIDPSRTGNNSPNIGSPFPEQLTPDESEHEHQDEPKEQPQDAWEPSEVPKYSLYSKILQERKSASQSRLQFYLDDEWINIGLLTPEWEDNLETVAHRFARQDRKQSIAVAGGTKQIAIGALSFTLTTEHMLLAVVLDNGDAGRWLRENGFDAAELFQRIDALHHFADTLETADGRRQTAADASGKETEWTAQPSSSLLPSAVCRLPSFYRLLDAAANRGQEAIRVLEDYVRFMRDDAELTQQLKTFRHQFQEILKRFPMESRLESRNTEYDVGTDISAEGEYERPTMDDLVSANFSRLQEALRSLEEFSKMSDTQAARQFEQLRYLSYTLHKETADGRRQIAADASGKETEWTAQPSSSLLPSAVCRLPSLYVLVDCRSDESAFEQLVSALIAGGVDIIQLRDKQADDRMILARSRILKNCITESDRNVLFIMNDRPDLAILAGADGVHVGQEELPAALVRQMVGTMLIGVSTHSIEQARQAVLDGADYIGVGPVFESETKEFSQLAGLAYLEEVAAEISIPAFAIGGITEDRLEEVFQTGICRVAVGSALLNAENPKEVAERWKEKQNRHLESESG
jgi:thiamine-phosphate pyrophosphorylase